QSSGPTPGPCSASAAERSRFGAVAKISPTAATRRSRARTESGPGDGEAPPASRSTSPTRRQRRRSQGRSWCRRGAATILRASSRGKVWSSRLLSAGRCVAPGVLDRRALADHQIDSAPEHALEYLEVDVCRVGDGYLYASRVDEANRDDEHPTRNLERQQSRRRRVERVADEIDIAQAGLLSQRGG